MIRRLTMLTAILLAIGGALFAPTADAQGAPTCQLFFGDLMLEIPVETDMLRAQPAEDSADLIPMVDYYRHDCADAVAYPGPFTNMPTVPLSPYAAANGITAAPQPVAVTAAAATPAPALALSGSETAVLAYLGTGLVAFGAFALGIRRDSASE